ncbi:hypothetical protein [Tateyamaria sp. syn59]|uniref:hypothetical protein n=1 Tax=Tateyamaria sp. syn59 TaxID=2576942 RepID=UPI0011BDF227|nr:hypothetical protein [Tateyamaria sp. syn59]
MYLIRRLWHHCPVHERILNGQFVSVRKIYVPLVMCRTAKEGVTAVDVNAKLPIHTRLLAVRKYRVLYAEARIRLLLYRYFNGVAPAAFVEKSGTVKASWFWHLRHRMVRDHGNSRLARIASERAE